MQAINVEGIKLYAYHGCLPEETLIGGNYIVDVYMRVDFMEAAISDDLNKTIDYCTVYETVKREMGIPSKLIESVGKRIYDSLKGQFPGIGSLKVRVTKLLPPMNGQVERVSIEIGE